MIGKIILVMFAIVLMFVALFVSYQNLPAEPVSLIYDNPQDNFNPIIKYSATPVFADNMRFNHNDISFSIGSSCSKARRNSMIEAFVLFQEKMPIISFYEVGGTADIYIECSDEEVELSGDYFAAGEGGPSRVINTSNFKIIEEGKVLLYRDTQCTFPLVELHELFHVFGFDHSVNPRSIMYNVSSCDQRITQDIIDLVNELYSVEPLPDAVVGEISAVKKGKYLDFNITVLNEGLIGLGNMELFVVVEGEEIQSFSLGKIDVGFGRVIKAENIKLPSRNVEVIDFIIDVKNTVRELNKENNAVRMMVE